MVDRVAKHILVIVDAAMAGEQSSQAGLDDSLDLDGAFADVFRECRLLAERNGRNPGSKGHI